MYATAHRLDEEGNDITRYEDDGISSGCQAAVLWTKPPDDATQQDEISSNEWGGCDDEVHCLYDKRRL